MKALHGNRTPRGLPSFPRQARNLAAAATRAIGAALSGRPVLVPEEVRLERETICAACPENLSGRCRKCGCGVRAQLIRKTHLATERCPLNPPKWTAWHCSNAATPLPDKNDKDRRWPPNQ
jgi:hypothetical protein